VGAEKLVNVVLSGLGWELKYIRNQRGLSLEVVCQQLRWQQSKLSRMENGQQHISDADLGALLVIYRVHGEDRRRLLRLAQRQDAPGYWELDPPQVAGTWTLVRLEQEATSIVDAETMLIPGLVHTEDYARALMLAGNVPPEQVEPRVQARMERRSLLTRDNAPKFEMILDETALRRPLGSRSIMVRQLRALLKVAELPNVRLWVVPFELGASVGFHYSFYLMGFPRNKSVVFLEQKTSGVYLEEADKTEVFRRHAARLAKIALNPAESIDRIATIAKEHKRE